MVMNWAKTYLNTSYVEVKRSIEFPSTTVTGDLNTSYVEVKHSTIFIV